MVEAEYTCEDHKEETCNDEKHPHCHYMVLLFFVFREFEASEAATWAADLENRLKMECLDQEEEPEFAMV